MLAYTGEVYLWGVQRMKISKIIVGVLISSSSFSAVSARNIDVLCYGTNQTDQGVTYNQMNYGVYWVTSDEEKKGLLILATNTWAKNRPADTWSCKAFEEESDSEYAAVQKLSIELTERGYKAYVGDEARLYAPKYGQPGSRR